MADRASATLAVVARLAQVAATPFTTMRTRPTMQHDAQHRGLNLRLRIDLPRDGSRTVEQFELVSR